MEKIERGGLQTGVYMYFSKNSLIPLLPKKNTCEIFSL